MQRLQFQTILSRLQEPRKFIQLITGPRQVGKTTVVKQVMEALTIPHLFVSADGVNPDDTAWIANQWQTARLLCQQSGNQDFVLAIDEIQTIRDWSKLVKAEYDRDTWNDTPIKVVLLGSSRVMLMKGMSESLMGRFEVINMPYWSYPEMRDTFGWTLEQYIYFGGFPGPANLIQQESRWRTYIKSSIIEATMNKDVLIDRPVNYPALLKRTLELASAYSGQELSVQKMIGELQDFGSANTAKDYLDLLDESGLVSPLQKFSVELFRRRSSIPKMQVYNNALRSYYLNVPYAKTIMRPELWGRLYESCVGAHLLNGTFGEDIEVYYWRERSLEVDYVLRHRDKVIAIEVKSNQVSNTAGLDAFRKQFNPYRAYVVGAAGIPLDTFLSIPAKDLFN